MFPKKNIEIFPAVGLIADSAGDSTVSRFISHLANQDLAASLMVQSPHINSIFAFDIPILLKFNPSVVRYLLPACL